MTGKHPNVLVIGGGIIGSTIAFMLAKQGASVTVLERDTPGGITTRASAGLLTPTAENLQLGPMRDLAVQSIKVFPTFCKELLEETGVDVEYWVSGIMLPAYAEDIAKDLQARKAALRDPGLQWISPKEALEREPALNPALLGALLHSQEAQLMPRKLIEAVTLAAKKREVTFHFGTEVTGLLKTGSKVTGVTTSAGTFHADQTVIAMGSWSGALAQWAAVPLVMKPVKGQMLSLTLTPRSLNTVIYGRPGYLVPRKDGTIWVGATSEQIGFDTNITQEGINWLMDVGKKLMPALANATFVSAWAGLRPGTADDQLVLGPVSGVQGLILATGHYRNGILLSLSTSEHIARYVLTGEDVALKPFTVERFAVHHTSK